MIYYFVDPDGHITTEDNVKGWFDNDPNAYTVKAEAVTEAKRRIRDRIDELETYYFEISVRGWKP